MNPPLLIAWVWQPVGSPLHIIGGAAVLSGLAVFAYARTFRGRVASSSCLLVMRLAFIAAMAVLLMGPSRMPPETSATNRPRLSNRTIEILPPTRPLTNTPPPRCTATPLAVSSRLKEAKTRPPRPKEESSEPETAAAMAMPAQAAINNIPDNVLTVNT